MNEQEKEQLSLSMYGIVRSIKDTLSLPTHDTLARTLIYNIALFLCSLISRLLGFYTFISWQGSLACLVSLVVLLWIERAENDTLAKAYKRGQNYLAKAKKLAQGRTVKGDTK